jgi:hypothetical protein
MVAAPASARTPVLQLPDLRQELPAELMLTTADGHMRLGFRSATDNIGLGPLIIEGNRPNLRRNWMSATQIIDVDNGPRVRRDGDGSLSYVRLATHQHWHLADFMRYELRRESDHEFVRPGMKTGFCLGDRVNLDIFTRMPNEPEAAVYTGQCGLKNPALTTIREGISVGHADYYAPSLEGQWMDITTVPDGRYWLVHRADAANQIFELDESNNAASLLLDIQRVPVEGGKQFQVRVLRACPTSAYC